MPEVKNAVLQNGIYTFPDDDNDTGSIADFCLQARQMCPPTNIDDPYFGRYQIGVCAKNNQNKCVCDADISYPILKGDSISPLVSKTFKALAKTYACKLHLGITKLHYNVKTNRNTLFSVVFNSYQRDVGSVAGSCTSEITAITLNPQTGHVYKMNELLEKNQAENVKQAILSYFGQHFIPPGEFEIKNGANRFVSDSRLESLKNLLEEKFWQLGFYEQDGQIFVDLNDYLLGCSSGPSFPIPIPSRFINQHILGSE